MMTMQNLVERPAVPFHGAERVDIERHELAQLFGDPLYQRLDHEDPRIALDAGESWDGFLGSLSFGHARPLLLVFVVNPKQPGSRCRVRAGDGGLAEGGDPPPREAGGRGPARVTFLTRSTDQR